MVLHLLHHHLRVDSHALGGVVGLVNADETVRELEHVIAQRDDDELGVLCAFLQEGNTRTCMTI